MGRLRLVGSWKLHVSFAEYSLFCRALLQKRPIILRSLLIEATPSNKSAREYHNLRDESQKNYRSLLQKSPIKETMNRVTARMCERAKLCERAKICERAKSYERAKIACTAIHLQPKSVTHFCCVGWLLLVGSIKLQVSFAKVPCKRDGILQKRPIILRSLLIVARP